MKESENSPDMLFEQQGQDNEITLQFIISKIESGTGLRLSQLKDRYSEDKLFFIGLRHVTTTKKALCEALNIPVEAACRCKRKLEKDGQLVQSAVKVVCPYTKHFAHLISTNPSEFDKLKRMAL